MNNKKLVLLLAVLPLFYACQPKNSGQLVGASYGKSTYDRTPYGMVHVEGSSFLMGTNGEAGEVFSSGVVKPRTVTVVDFWMDETEITNAEYRQFTNWVRDYVVRERLADPELGARDEFLKRKGETTSRKGLSSLFGKKKKVLDYDEDVPTEVDMSQPIPWDEIDENEDVKTAISTLYYKGEDVLDREDEIDYRQLNYSYRWVNYSAAAKRENKFDVNRGGFVHRESEMPLGGDSSDYFIRRDTSVVEANKAIAHSSRYIPLQGRSSFIQSRVVNIYPDTLCWMRDYSDSFNEPMMKNYYAHPGYKNYPVVGVSWEQATAFAHWRTRIAKDAGENSTSSFRLPTESEWEFASRGGKEQALYPWGGGYTRNKKGCFLANFKPMRGRYSDDGYVLTSETGAYPPNDYGLYDMAGNVAEWTITSYSETAYEMMHDLNPDYRYEARNSDPKSSKRKVVRGGSWKDTKHFLQNGVRAYEYQYETRSYIGFRCVKTYLGSKIFQ